MVGRRRSSVKSLDLRRRSSTGHFASRKTSLIGNHKETPKRSSIIEEEDEILEDIDTFKIIPSDSESIIDGLLSDYYKPDFMSRFNSMGIKSRTSAMTHLLSLFEKIDKLLQVTHCTSLNMDLDGAIQKIIMDTEEMMQAEMILLYEVDPDTNEIVAKDFDTDHLSDVEKHVLQRRIYPAGSGIAGYVAVTGDIVNVNDPSSFPRYHPIVDTGATEIVPKDILAAPILTLDGPVIAVIQAINRFGQDGSYESFNENDEFLLKTLGKTLGIVMTNARAMERMTEMNKKVKVLLDTTRFLSSTLDFDTLIKMIMEAAKELLNADRCTLFLKDDARKQLVAKIVMKDSIQEIRIKMDAGIAGSVLMSGSKYYKIVFYFDNSQSF
jgi:adenylate cyclase